MSRPTPKTEKIIPLDRLLQVRSTLKTQGRKVVFTNGCYDLFHAGHIHTLTKAKEAGDILVVALNSDSSVQLIKGPDRPITPENERMEVMAAMRCVDYVILFDEPDPGRIIDLLLPDILVKGGDWAENAIVGRETVESHGGYVLRVPPVPGRSSTNIIEKIMATD